MNGERLERRLAAILAADIAGYSRLMGADEEGTLSRLKALRGGLIDPKIAEHRGRIVKTTGDGILIEFASVVDALRCAAEVQAEMGERNADVPSIQRIEFRVGIHQGDIIVEGDDIFGDGVNIAARLEGLAEPGGICVSGRVQEDAAGRLDLAFEDLGEQPLKNIARPVRIYRVRTTGIPAAASQSPTPAPSAPRLSIVVLPFSNLSGDASEDYFVDAITEDITTDLSRVPNSLVISRNTAFTYKGTAVNVRQVSRELGVRYILEGSIRLSGTRVRANAKLIDAETDAHLFADRFDCERADLIDVQDEITARIAGAVGAELIDAESRRSLREHLADPDAVDLSMRGWAALRRAPSREVVAEARVHFEQALGIDSSAVDALIGLAYTYARALNSAFSDNEEADHARGSEFAAKALTLAPDRAQAHWVHGLLLRRPKRFEEAAAAFEKAIALDRNFAPAYGSLGDLLTWLGRPEETITINKQAMRLSPRDPQLANWLFDIGGAYWYLGQIDDALTWLLRARATNPKLPFVAVLLVAVYTALGRSDAARAELAKAQQEISWLTSIERLRAFLPTTDPKMLERDQQWYHALAAAGLPKK
jgi:adenylate cyclase